MAWVRAFYAAHSRRISLFELLFIFGLLFIHRWMVPFYHWGIYRLELPFPEILSNFFYGIWLEKEFIRAVLVVVLIAFILFSNFIRRYSFRELGIRFDNLWTSGRECLVALCVILAIAMVVGLALSQSISLERYVASGHFTAELSEGLLSGFAQQFLLQSVVLVRALQLFRGKLAAVLTSSVLFSLLHAPNVMLMALTLVFGALCSVLFLRNRNVITLGILHGAVQQVVRIILASVLVTGVSYYNADYYDYSLRVGPRRGEPDFLAKLEYDASRIKVDPSGSISVTISATNKSTLEWDSHHGADREFLSYHLLDSDGNVVSWNNPMTPFETTVKPGETATVDIVVNSPLDGEQYYAEVDVVKQQVSGSRKVTLFKYKGSKSVLVPLLAP
ncbi:CPBP family intramembrane glutamic endopeptidase [Mesorhizobium sp. KR9-304]|uniref:CPBP family intramembrane glutamic endopeptidase n=1 Tax=Mesorhizobium sp. KR9-304 TaxID=3156614 RepID=UPI0032B5EABD